MANVYRRAADLLERSSNDKWCTLIGCCEAISDAEHNYDAAMRACEMFSEWFKPNPLVPSDCFWWPLDLEHVLPRLIALDLMALIAEDECAGSVTTGRNG